MDISDIRIMVTRKVEQKLTKTSLGDVLLQFHTDKQISKQPGYEIQENGD